MTRENSDAPNTKAGGISEWQSMLKDRATLFARPGVHYRNLVIKAQIVHKAQTIISDDLSDALELTDGALADAVETTLDFGSDE